MNAEYTISTDKEQLNVLMIHEYLSKQSYWAQNIPINVVERSIEHSICFGVYREREQVGFARVVTDQATFAHLADVFVLPEHRGNGVSKLLIKTILEWPTLQGLRRWMLGTNDAHGLYRQFGFTELDKPELFMQRRRDRPYQTKDAY